jgi:RNA polymerase sigma-70 factor (ECF subfamily)
VVGRATGVGRGQEFLDAALPHLESLSHLARSLSSSRQDAEDLLQETFLRGYAHFDQFRGHSVRAWLAAICLNVARSEARRRSRRVAESLSADIDIEATPAEEVEDDVAARLERSAVRRALSELPEPQRMCIVLMDVAGYTASDTAAVLGCPRGTVLARVHRGRRRLAVLLHEAGVDRGEA